MNINTNMDNTYNYLLIIIFKILILFFISNYFIVYIKGIFLLLYTLTTSSILQFNHKPMNKLWWNFAKNIMLKKNIKVINKKLISNYKKGYIIISNHINPGTDILAIKILTDCHIVIGASTLKNNFNYFSFIENNIFSNLKLISYDSTNNKNGEEIKKKIISLVRNKEKVLVFPEGRVNINTSCELRKFKKGLFYTAWNNNIPILTTSIHYTDNDFGVDNSKNKKFDYFNLFRSDTKIYFEIIKFIYPKNYLNFDDFYNDAYNTINNNLKKYNK